MADEDNFNFTLKEYQILKVCLEWYHTYGTTTKGDDNYDYSDISRRVGQEVDHKDFAQIVKKLEEYINGLAYR